MRRILAALAVAFILLAGCPSQPPANVTIGNISPQLPPALNLTPPANLTTTNATPGPQVPAQRFVVSPCDRIQTQPEQDECILNVSVSLAEASVCQQVESNEIRLSCAMLVAASKGSEACEALPEETYRDRCLLAIAGLPAGSGACAKITGAAAKSECEARTAPAGDLAACERIPEPGRSSCISRAALASLDANACNALSLADREQCVYAVALRKRDSETCALLASGLKQKCEETILQSTGFLAAIQSLDAGKCAAFEAPLNESCISSMGVLTKNISLCERILNTSFKAECLDAQTDLSIVSLAGDALDPSLCSFVKDRAVKDRCILEVSTLAMNSTYCPGISEEFFRNACFEQAKPSEQLPVYVANSNVPGCKSLYREAERDDCLLQIAKNAGDASICSDIISNQTKEACLNATA